MAIQMRRIQLKLLVLQSKTVKTLILGLCVLAASIYSAQTASCPPSVTSPASTTTERHSFTEFDYTYTYGIAGGPVSNSFYYLYKVFLIPSTYAAVVRREDSAGSQVWQASFSFIPVVKSFSVDAAEQSVYFASNTATLVVLKLNSSGGTILSQHQYTGISGNNDDIKIWLLSDLSGYFFIGYDSSNIAKICKYTFSSSSAQCQTITNIKFGYGHLMISNGQFFVLGIALSSPNNLNMYKITFSATPVNWANQIACTSGTCSAFLSESVLSFDKSKIYLFFSFGKFEYLYYAGLSVSGGSVVTARYKSSTPVGGLNGSVLKGDYIIATTFSPFSLIVYSISSSTFTIKSFISGHIYGCIVDPSSDKFIIVGFNGRTYGFTTKFVPQSIGSNSDYISALWSMTALSTGTDDIVSQGVVSIGTVTSIAIGVGIYTNQSATYSKEALITFDSYLQTETLTFSVSESTISIQNPNLPCSFLGSTSIVYRLISYDGANIPSFVSIDSATGVLSISAPKVSSSTNYSFYIVSTVSGVSGPIVKIINLTVKKCTVSHCQKCLATDSSICEICDSGYSLSSGSCISSKISKSLSILCQVIMGAIIVLCVASRLLSLFSMASCWSMINQTQIFFLLLITGAFIPSDIEVIITGLKIYLNPFAYFQSISGGNSNFVSTFFDFGLQNSNLDNLGIKSDSTAVNIYSFIISMLLFYVLHLCVAILQKFLMKTSNSNCCQYALDIVHWILEKLMVLFYYALYIRIILITNQYILVSCINEVYSINVSGAKRIISSIIAFVLLIVCIIMIFAVTLLVFIWKDNSEEESLNKRIKYAHLFDGISPNKKSRLYIAILQIRRIIFVIFLITVGPVSSFIVICILVGLQVIYLLMLIIIKPYELVKCNIIEIVNEMYFFTMLASLLKFNSIESWEGTPTVIYTWFIASNIISGFVIILNVQPIVASRADYAGDDIEPSSVQINSIKPVKRIRNNQMERDYQFSDRF